MKQPATRRTDFEQPLQRTFKEVMQDFALTSALLMNGVLAVFAWIVLDKTNERRLDLAEKLGMSVLENYGWAFGGYISVLLGFFVVVIGGQYIGDAGFQHKIRRDLGTAGILIASSLLPSIFIILIGCIAKPEKAGALFFVIPSAALVVFLALRLAAFGVLEKSLKIAAAREQKVRARLALSKLTLYSTQNSIAVMLANFGLAFVIGLVVELVSRGLVFSFGLEFFTSIPLCVGLDVLCILAAVNYHRTRISSLDPRRNWIAIFMIAVTFILATAVLWGGVGLGSDSGFVLIVANIAFLLFAAALKGRKDGSIVTEWSLWGAAAKMAHSTLEYALVHADMVLDELEIPRGRRWVGSRAHSSAIRPGTTRLRRSGK